jgi:Fic family protein
MPDPALNELLRRIDARKSEVDALRPLTQEQEHRIMQKFRLDWNFHSNAIEGNSLTYGETIAFLMEGLTAKGKPFKDHLDIKGHNEGIDYLMHFIQNREELNEKVIRELHQMILVEAYANPAQTTDGQRVEKRVTLGAYKSMPNHVKTPTGEIHYYATPEETPAKMTDLLTWLHQQQQKNDLHSLVLAAIFHHRFVAIHPFDDGNGRMSRLLMNLLLMQYGYPPVVIKQQDRQAYYYALRQADAGDLFSFIEYVGENLLHSLDIQLKGARGESLDEDDDLDKEIALLKVSLGKDDVVPKSVENLYQLLSQTILPLLKEIRKQCSKLDELFFDQGDEARYGTVDDKTKQILTPQDWVEINVNWFQAGWSKALSTENFKLEYEYHWKEFKKTIEPFNLDYVMYVNFHRFKYEIEFSSPLNKYKISKSYTEKLSQEEFVNLSRIFVKEALAQIKSRTQKDS